jgi:hypothetical protein
MILIKAAEYEYRTGDWLQAFIDSLEKPKEEEEKLDDSQNRFLKRVGW